MQISSRRLTQLQLLPTLSSGVVCQYTVSLADCRCRTAWARVPCHPEPPGYKLSKEGVGKIYCDVASHGLWTSRALFPRWLLGKIVCCQRASCKRKEISTCIIKFNVYLVPRALHIFSVKRLIFNSLQILLMSW